MIVAAGVLSCSDTPTEPPPPPPPPPVLTFNIDFRFVPGANPTDQQREELEAAAARWQQVVVGDLPPFQVSEPNSFQCERVTAPPMNEQVDDLVVWIDFGPFDGQGGIAAWAGVCVTRDNHLPVVSSILFDEADLSGFTTQLALHEFGHTLGFGEVWNEMGLLVDAVNPVNGGPGALQAVEDATVSSFSAAENFGLPGSSLLSTNLVAGRNLGVWTSGPDDEELRTFLRFDLSGLRFESPITRATLIMNASGAMVQGQPNATVYVGLVAEPWSEASVTWNNQPATGPSEAGRTFFSPCNTCLWDIRDVVQDMLDGTAENRGFYLMLRDVESTNAYLGLNTRHASDPESRPRLFISPDTRFIGQHAIEQFDAMGGAAYGGPKVPAENDYLGKGEAVDGHWRSRHFIGEVMSSVRFTEAKLSAITIGALEDMGYEVDYTEADPFEVKNVP